MVFSAPSVSHSLSVSQILNGGLSGEDNQAPPGRKASPARSPKLLGRVRELLTKPKSCPQQKAIAVSPESPSCNSGTYPIYRGAPSP
jgi:hypothetical protein